MNESFLSYRRFRYLKLALLLAAVCMAVYSWHEPLQAPNGGTWLGYTLGGLSAFLILSFIGYGVRKRRFASRAGSVRGWLSAHVYFGVALVLIATLHSGFQFGWNVHTLAWLLMLLVVLTGIYGAFAYARYPSLITANRAGEDPERLLEQLDELEQEALRLADGVGEDMRRMVLQSFRHTRIGGGVWAQLSGRAGRGARLDRQAEQYLRSRSEKIEREARMLWEAPEQSVLEAQSTVQFVAGEIAAAEPGERVQTLRRIMEIIERKRQIGKRLNRDIRHRARLQFWLYLHVPLSFALLAALIAHVFSVFFYW